MKNVAALVLVVTFCFISTTAVAELPEKGFFVGGGGTLFMIDGSLTVGPYEVNVTDDLYPQDFDTVWEDMEGLSWGNKMLFGLKPTAGFKVSTQFAIAGKYNFLFTKKGDQSFAYTGTVYTGTLDAESEYKQGSFQPTLFTPPVVTNTDGCLNRV